ncbi:MAG: DUF2892 domain-containing protein [Phycisphaerales bacterium]
MCRCRNVGGADRAVRLVIGIVALVLAFTMLGVTGGAAMGIAAAVVGAIMLLTAALGMCPLYLPLKLSTCRVARE